MNAFQAGEVACIWIDGRRVGPGEPPFIVAELSGNHNGDLGRALALIDAAHAAGADAVKLQTYTADTLTIDCDGPHFRIESGPWAGQRLYDLYASAHTPWAWHEALFDRARSLGLSIFSTPFDPSSVAFLERFEPPAYKIASFEAVDLPLIECVAATGRPLILSTGLATFEEVDEAIAAAACGAGIACKESRHCEEALADEAIQASRGTSGSPRRFAARDDELTFPGKDPAVGARRGGLILLHCVSGYPSAPEEAGLGRMAALAARTGLAVGLSDHSLGTTVAVAATALGAVMIEKHLTLSRADGGADAAFSMEPDEFAALARDCRTAWRAANGSAEPGRTGSEQASVAFRRSLFIVDDVAAGEVFTPANVRSIRPGHGLAPKHLPQVLGRRAACSIARGTPLAWEMIAD
ncbi:MAG: N-acetylneuraminate synthase family protein [Rhodospirillales bacterium]|nr:N-acetylneuraminate synthase family protein [Rhodospirillales bacterium]